jgi:hypothetical protein
MRIERSASNSMTLQARPTVTPSKWLIRFVRVDGGDVQVCIAQATPRIGHPVQLTFDEVSTGADPLVGEVTLVPGQWHMGVSEQASATNLDYLQADRIDVFTALIEVVGADGPPAPSITTCDIIEAQTWPETKDCMSDAAIEAAIEDLCEVTPCDDPVTVNINSTPVAQGDCGDEINIDVRGTDSQAVGSLVNTNLWEIGNGTVTVNGELFDGIVAEGSLNIPVVDCNGDPIGTVEEGIRVVVPCAEECDPLTATLGGVEIINEADPCGLDLVLECSDPVDAVLVTGGAYAGLYAVGDLTGLDINETHTIGKVYRFGSFVIYEHIVTVGPDTFRNWWHVDGTNETTLATSNSVQDPTPLPTPWDSTWIVFGGGDPPAWTYTEATIGDICAVPCPEPCGFVVEVNGDQYGYVEDACDLPDNALNICVTLDGTPSGEFNPDSGCWEVVSDCPPCDPLTASFAGFEVASLEDPCGNGLELDCTTLAGALTIQGTDLEPELSGVFTWNGTEFVNCDASATVVNDPIGPGWRVFIGATSMYISADYPEQPWNAVAWSRDFGVGDLTSMTQGTIHDVCCGCEGGGPCDDGEVKVNGAAYDTVAAGGLLDVIVQDSAATPVGTVIAGPAVEIDDVTVQLRDSAANNIGSPVAYLAESTNNLTAPDGTVRTTDGLTTVTTVRSNANADLPQSQVKYRRNSDNSIQVLTAADTEFASGTLRPATIIPRRAFNNSAGSDASPLQATIDAADLVNNTVPVAADAQVYTSDGVTLVQAIPANDMGALPPSVIKYKDAANVSQKLAASNTEFDATNLLPATEIPRRELYDDTPAPLGLYVTAADLINDTVPQVPAAAAPVQAILASWVTGHDTTIPVVLPAEYQGKTYDFVSATGSNGTITVSVNGGSSYAAPPFTVGASGVSFKRTTFSAAGSALYEE